MSSVLAGALSSWRCGKDHSKHKGTRWVHRTANDSEYSLQRAKVFGLHLARREEPSKDHSREIVWSVSRTSQVPRHQLGRGFYFHHNFIPARTISPLIKPSKLLAPPLVPDITNRKLYPWANLCPILSWNKEQLFSHLDVSGVKEGPLVFSADCK